MNSIQKIKFKETEIGPIPEEWEVFSLNQLGRVITGKTPSKENPYDWGSSFDFITPSDIFLGEKHLSSVSRKISQAGFNRFKKIIIPPKSVIVTCIGSDMGKVVMNRNDSLTNQQINSIVINDDFDNDYVYYYLKYLYPVLWDHAGGGSTMPIINKSTFGSLKISAPKLVNEQKQTAEILSSLDDKIELNRKINNNLEKIASTLFKHWFIDYEFSDKNGKPYRSSGGKIIRSELGDIPDGWKIKKLGDFFPVKTGKKDANIAGKIGKYPFFSCSQDILYTDEYSFDSSSLLLAGNGDFNIKLYEGKFEAYQRTYVLTPYKKELIGFLLFLISNFLDKITAGHRGSVIKFITKGMIEDFKISVPSDVDLDKMADIFYKISGSIDFYKRENNNLSQIRDLLLPKLMSGKIRVKI